MSQITTFNLVGTGFVSTLTGNAGGAISPVLGNINIVGAGGVTVTGAGNTLTITVAAGGMTWSRPAGAAVAAAADNGYVPTNVGITTFTLPAAAALGTVIEIIGESAAGWSIAQNAGQNVQHGNVSTTPGVGGSLSSTNRYDTVRLICRVANTTWAVTSSTGVLNVI